MPSQSRALLDLKEAIAHHEGLRDTLVYSRTLASTAPRYEHPKDLPRTLSPILERRGITGLYEHQVRSFEALGAGEDVALATPTASGKSLVYSLPVLADALRDPEARALFLFPLRALEQDQARKLEADIAALGPAFAHLRVAVYDGDTKPSLRKKLRNDPPQVLITTPDMLHLGLLPYHENWRTFFENLRTVVIDELHTYRGIFGSHIAHVFRRLDRVARHHGARPRVVTTSATIGNPGELAHNLTARKFTVIEQDGSPRSERHVCLLNPTGSPYTTAALLFREAVSRGLRTIAFTKARTITELMFAWITEADPGLAEKISAYRSGFLPEERREIEKRLFRGDLLGVISTSALEMGIDVGGLDVCILVGYPGSQTTTWQRAGRVGRGRDALVALVAQPDALDQYLVAHPKLFFSDTFEHAVLDPTNRDIASGHLPCAAAEIPLRDDEPWLGEAGARENVQALEEAGKLLRSETGNEWFAVRRRPHRDVDLRSAGASYAIVETTERGEPRLVGSIGSGRVFAECHEGAIYLHRGRQFLVTELDIEERRVHVRAVRAPYYTRATSDKETEILSRERARPAGNFRIVEGRLKVTTWIKGYERRRVRGQDVLGTETLELPPSVLETRGVWLEMPDELGALLRAEDRHPMGSIHACEHAMLALVPLFALCDRFDVAGISYTRHPQLGKMAVFLYDGHAGGAGLTTHLFDRIEALLEATHEMVRECDCEEGCPRCVHSPKCGSGNRPIDKPGALRALSALRGLEILPTLPEKPAAAVEPIVPAPAATQGEEAPRILFFDLETQRSASEVGGWHNASLMRVALAVTYDSRAGAFRSWREAEVTGLIDALAGADLVVGFNVHRFDYRVLAGYSERPLAKDISTFDMLDEIHARIGFRLGLGHLGEETLARPKSADGLQSLRWWKEGKIDAIERYCRDDVALLRDLFQFASAKGHLLFRTKSGERVRLPMHVSVPELIERAHKKSVA